MADIFLSYSHNDQKQAAALAGKLESQSWSVFWDRELLPGRKWSDTLKTELDNARCVVVLWTESSKDSKWVRDEAKRGLERDIQVQKTIRAKEEELITEELYRRGVIREI